MIPQSLIIDIEGFRGLFPSHLSAAFAVPHSSWKSSLSFSGAKESASHPFSSHGRAGRGGREPSLPAGNCRARCRRASSGDIAPAPFLFASIQRIGRLASYQIAFASLSASLGLSCSLPRMITMSWCSNSLVPRMLPKWAISAPEYGALTGKPVRAIVDARS